MDPAGGTKLEELEEQLQELYRCLVAGDRIAAPKLAELIWTTYASRGSLINALKVNGWIADHEEAKDELLSLVAEFATKFVAAILDGTSTYDPAKSPLGAYIQMALHGDVLNEAAKMRNLKARNTSLENEGVGEPVYPWNLQQTPEEQVLDQLELTDEELEKAMRFLDSLSPEDRVCVDLIAAGVRETEQYAEALSITHLSIEKQRKTVNNIKDRLNKKMKRLR